MMARRSSRTSASGSFNALELLRAEGFNASNPDPWFTDFKAVRLDWFALLNQQTPANFTKGLGLSSGLYSLDTPVGLARTYLKLGTAIPTEADLSAIQNALKSGAAVASTGPLLDVSINGTGPGGTVSGAALNVSITVYAPDWVPIDEAFALCSLGLYVVVRVISAVFKVDEPVQKSLIATTLFPNSGNLGLSLTLLALGQLGLERAIVTYVASALLVFGVGPGLVSGGGFKKGLKTTLRLPSIWALAFGLGLHASGIGLPSGVADGLHLMGEATVSLLLITLGLQIARTRFTPRADDFLASGLRLGVGPMMAYGAGMALGLDHLTLQVFVLQCATPTAVNAFLITAEFGGDGPRADQPQAWRAVVRAIARADRVRAAADPR